MIALAVAVVGGGLAGALGVSYMVEKAQSSTALQTVEVDGATGDVRAASRNVVAANTWATGLLGAGGMSTDAGEGAMARSDPELVTAFAQDTLQGMMPQDAPRIMQASLSVDNIDSGTLIISKTPPPEPVDMTLTLKKGEKLEDKLIRLGVKPATARVLAQRLRNARAKIPAGGKIALTLDRQLDFFGSDAIYPVYLSFVDISGRRVIVDTDEDGGFLVHTLSSKLARSKGKKNKAGKKASPAQDFHHVRGRVTSTLYAAARDKGVPRYIISQMLRAFAHQVDLQRQIRKGDTFEILYGKSLTGGKSRRHILHYAAVTLRGKKLAFYRFVTSGGKVAYIDSKGRSSGKGLMITPISGARISSGYGLRRHPVLGYTKMHTGIDFAAPRGTPIRAAGDGIIKYAAWRGGYGRAIIIKHDNGYETLYAHQTRFARGIRKGVRVRQGQVIGYVGATGRVTGPHLHYEVRKNGKRINPLRVRTAHRIRLKGKELARFRAYRGKIDRLLRTVPASSAKVAQK